MIMKVSFRQRIKVIIIKKEDKSVPIFVMTVCFS